MEEVFILNKKYIILTSLTILLIGLSVGMVSATNSNNTKDVQTLQKTNSNINKVQTSDVKTKNMKKTTNKTQKTDKSSSNTSSNANTITTVQGQKTKLNATIKDTSGNGILTNVTFKVDDKVLGVVKTDKNGNASLSYTFGKSYNKTNYILNITSASTNIFEGSSTICNLTVLLKTNTKVDAITTPYNGNITYTAHVTDINGKKVNTGNVSFGYDTNYFAIADVVNGTATATTSLQFMNTIGKHNLSAVYNSNDKYYTSNGTNILTLTKVPTRIVTNNITMDTGLTVTNTIYLLDNTNFSVAESMVDIYLNNKKVSSKNTSNGSINFTYTAPKVDSGFIMPFKVVYAGNDHYQNAKFKGYIRVNAYNKLYVSPNGNDNNVGNSTSPLRTLKNATVRINNKGTIYLKAGQYKESEIGINKTINIKGLASKNKVILNAKGQDKIILQVLDKKTVSISNITVMNSNIKSKNYSSAFQNRGTLKLTNTVFKNNQVSKNESSAAIYNIGTLIITKSVFQNNTSLKSNGGAIRSIKGKVIIKNSQFTKNKVQGNDVGGGAIFTYKATINISNSKFTSNKAQSNNVSGGAIKFGLGTAIIKKSTFINNKIEGTKLSVGGAVASLNTKLKIESSIFKSNSLNSKKIAEGGALYNQNSKVTITKSTFTKNKAKAFKSFAAGIYLFNSQSTIKNTKVNSNTLIGNNKKGRADGTAVYVNKGNLTSTKLVANSNTAKANNTFGGAIYFVGKNMKITSSKFSKNLLKGKLSEAGAVFTVGKTTIKSTTFSKNKAPKKNSFAGAIGNVGNLTVSKSNFISNVASNATAISNTGKVKSIENNYWGSKKPNWTKLLGNVKKPSKYSKSII